MDQLLISEIDEQPVVGYRKVQSRGQRKGRLSYTLLVPYLTIGAELVVVIVRARRGYLFFLFKTTFERVRTMKSESITNLKSEFMSKTSRSFSMGVVVTPTCLP